MTNGKKIVRVRKKKRPPLGIRADGRPKKEIPESDEILERRQNAMDLRASGVPYDRIAKELGYYDKSHARQDINKGIANIEMDAAKMVITQDIALMDEFKMRCLHALRNNGDLSQIDRIMRVMDKKYSLLAISDETVRQLQSERGITVNVGGSTTTVMNVQAATESNEEFVAKMMRAVGVDPNSKEAKRYTEQWKNDGDRTLPMLEGGANNDKDVALTAAHIEDEEIYDAEIVEG
jgi:hypothetical protein